MLRSIFFYLFICLFACLLVRLKNQASLSKSTLTILQVLLDEKLKNWEIYAVSGYWLNFYLLGDHSQLLSLPLIC